jgi:hypothetical protein
MARMLKRWESPRREGRNDKGKGGSARQKQLRKRNQMLRKKLQDGSNQNQAGGENASSSLSFLARVRYSSAVDISFVRSWIPKQHVSS